MKKINLKLFKKIQLIKKLKFYRLFQISLSIVFLFSIQVVKAQIKDSLVFGSDRNFAPYEFLDNQNKPAGFNVDLINAIGREMNQPIKIKLGIWEKIRKELETENTIQISDMFFVPENEIHVDFGIPFETVQNNIYIQKNKTRVQSLKDLTGRYVAIQKASSLYFSIQANYPNIIILGVESGMDALKALEAGNCEAAIITETVYDEYVKNKTATKIITISEPILNADYGFVVSKNNPQILALINEGLYKVKASGEFDSLRKKWFNKSSAMNSNYYLFIFFLLLLIVLSWGISRYLQNKVKEKTKSLNKIIENQKIIEKELKNNQRFNESLVNLISSILYIYDLEENRYTFINDGIKKQLGYTISEILDLKENILPSLMHPEDFTLYQKNAAEKYQVAKDGDKIEFTYRMKDNNNKWHWIHTLEIIYSRNEDETPKQIFGVANDITETKEQEKKQIRISNELERRVQERTSLLDSQSQALQESREALLNLVEDLNTQSVELKIAKEKAQSADRLKSSFLSTMSHELRTPLNSIIGFTGILIKKFAGPLNEEQVKQLSMVKRSGQHLLNLINDVLDISKIEAGELTIINKPFDFCNLVNKTIESLEPLAKAKELKFITPDFNKIISINSDERRVEQIIINLLNNAIKFTKDGTVTLDCEINESMLEIKIKDSGIGIKKEDLKKLFIPFSQIETGLTRNHEGTGLGLSICQKLVQKLGGTIEVTSKFGSGSTFIVCLPLNEMESITENHKVYEN